MLWVDLGTVALLTCSVLLWWCRSRSRRLTILTGLALVTASRASRAAIRPQNLLGAGGFGPHMLSSRRGGVRLNEHLRQLSTDGEDR